MCSSIIINLFSRNLAMNLSFKGPSHPTQLSLGQFLMMRINRFKFSISSLVHFKLVMTPIILKICSISICDPTIPRTWWVWKKTCENLITRFAHQIKCFQSLLIVLPIINTIATHASMWIWLHHHLIQFAQKTGHHLELWSADLLLP
jgi:hypothetical protein